MPDTSTDPLRRSVSDPPCTLPRRATRQAAAWGIAAVTGLLLTVAGCSGETPSTATGPATPGSTTDEATPEARSDARLSLANNGGRVRYDGAVDSEASRQRVVDALVAAFGDAATGQVDVDATVRPPGWLDGLSAFAEAFTTPGAAVTFDGDTIELSGQVPREDRARLLALAEDLFPDHVYTGLLQGTTDGGSTPAALAQLPAGADGPALVDALNTVTIAFEPGSARIAPGSLDAIGRIADAIKASAGDTRLLLTGGGDGDQNLARQRAEALKVQLILNGISPALIDTAGGTGTGPTRFSLAP